MADPRAGFVWSARMKKLLNTLYVTSEDAWLHKDGQNVVVKVDGIECGRAPAHLLGPDRLFQPCRRLAPSDVVLRRGRYLGRLPHVW